MTNNQVLIFAVGLKSISPPEMNGDFNYAISSTLESAVAQAKHIREATKDSKEMEEYRGKLEELQKKHAKKDREGEPICKVIDLPNGSQLIQYNIPDALDPESEFNTKLKELNEEYDEDIKKQEERMKFLDEENNRFDPVFIERKDIPKGLSREEMNLILPLVKRD
jgi:hypothetical protein